jgi:PST family polysaccharide transporter
MSDIDTEIIEEEIASEPVLQEIQAVGLILRLQALIASQRRNLQNLSALVVCNFLAAGLFFVTQVKIANVIGREKFGLLAYGIALGMYGQTIVQYGMNRTLVRDLIHWPKRFAEMVMASLLLRGVLLGLVVTGLLIWKVLCRPADLSWAVTVVIVAYSLKSLDLQPVYDAWLKMGRHAAYNLIQRGLYFLFICTIVLWAPNNLSILLIGVGLLVAQVFYLILQQKWAFRRMDFGVSKAPLTSVAVDLSKSNLWIWLASMGLLSFGTLNQLILKYYCGAAELGGYAASWQIIAAAILLLTQVSRVGNPAMARVTCPEINRYKRKSFLLKYSYVMAATTLPVVIPSVLFPGWIVKTIFKPEYASSAVILRVMGIYLMVFSLGCVASQYVVSARMEKTYFASVILGGCLSVIFCFILIPRLAGLGAALSLLIAHGISMGLYWEAMIQHVRKQR